VTLEPRGNVSRNRDQDDRSDRGQERRGKRHGPRRTELAKKGTNRAAGSRRCLGGKFIHAKQDTCITHLEGTDVWQHAVEARLKCLRFTLAVQDNVPATENARCLSQRCFLRCKALTNSRRLK
jgi:hypothetical protein